MPKFLKRFLFVQTSGNKIIIGDNKKVIYVANNKTNRSTLEKLTGDGLEITAMHKNPLIPKLLDNDWLANDLVKLDRTALFFETLGVNFSEEVKSARILVLGAGGGGGTLLYMLAQFGFSNLHVLDYDLVEVSDCIKTLVYRHSDVGQPKVEVLRTTTKSNLGIDITTHFQRIEGIESLRKLIQEVAPVLIVNGIDPNPIHKLNLNKVCFELNIPFLPLHYSYEYFSIGPFVVPKLTCCYNSIREDMLRNSNQLFDISKIEKLHTDYLVHPSISILINTIASIGAKEIVFFLSNRHDLVLSLNHLLTMSMVNMVGELTELRCSHDCAICHGSGNNSL
jgi:hypothetical protein